jgi:pre-rRNA-processing protein TSR4
VGKTTGRCISGGVRDRNVRRETGGAYPVYALDLGLVVVYILICISVRSFRASVRNEEYVRDVEEKRALAEKEAAAAKELAKVNPFTVCCIVHRLVPDLTWQMSAGPPSGSTLFGSAQPLFGAAPSNPFAAPSSTTPDISSLSLAPSAPAATSPALAKSMTQAPPLPAYQPPLYLSTIDEYLLPPPDVEMESDSDDDEQDEEEAKAFAGEKWEKVLPKGVDEVFERFVRRLENADGGRKQVLR